MSLYTLFEILLYLVAATLLGFGIGWVVRGGRATVAPAKDSGPSADEARLREERNEARALVAEKKVELDALVSELAAMKAAPMTQRFLPDGPLRELREGLDEEEPSPHGTLDSWPPPDEEEFEEGDEESHAKTNQLLVMVAHLRDKLYDATREAQRAVEDREALAVELKAMRKSRDAVLDADAQRQVQIAEREAEAEALRERLNAAAREIEGDHEQVHRLDERLAGALTQVEDLEADVRRLAEERDNAVEWSEAIEAEMSALRRKMDEWEARRNELEHAFELFRAPLHSEGPRDAGPVPDEDSAPVRDVTAGS